MTTNNASSTVASDPNATSQSQATQDAAAAAAQAGAAQAPSAGAAANLPATGSSFGPLNPELVDPNTQYGVGSPSWWSAVQSFLEKLQQAYADWLKQPLQAGRHGAPFNPQGQSRNLIGGVLGLAGHAIDTVANAIEPSPTHSAEDNAPRGKGKKGGAKQQQTQAPGAPDMDQLREAAQAVGLVIPKNITSVDQLRQVRIPAPLRDELSKLGFNPLALDNLGVLSQQEVPLNRPELPQTAGDLYNQFTHDWGTGTGSFAKNWTQDLASAGLLPPQAISQGIGSAASVGNAYQALLGMAAKDKLTPAQELSKLQTSPDNMNNPLNSGVAPDAENAAKGIFYQYGINPSTATIQNIVNETLAQGFTSPYEVRTQAEALAAQQAIDWAKSSFPSIAGQITSDHTVQDIMRPYLNTAANMLGVNPDSIDLTDPKWQRALNGGAAGQMTTDEWARTLASDPAYGYQYSQAAKNQASSVAMSVRNLFGLEGPGNASSWNYSPTYQVG